MGSGFRINRRKRQWIEANAHRVLDELRTFDGDRVPILDPPGEVRYLTVNGLDGPPAPVREYSTVLSNGKTFEHSAVVPMNREQVRERFQEHTNHNLLQLRVCELAARIDPTRFDVPDSCDDELMAFARDLAATSEGKQALRWLGMTEKHLTWFGPVEEFLALVVALLHEPGSFIPDYEPLPVYQGEAEEKPEHPPPEPKIFEQSAEEGGLLSGLAPPAPNVSRFRGAWDVDGLRPSGPAYSANRSVFLNRECLPG